MAFIKLFNFDEASGLLKKEYEKADIEIKIVNKTPDLRLLFII